MIRRYEQGIGAEGYTVASKYWDWNRLRQNFGSSVPIRSHIGIPGFDFLVIGGWSSV